MRIIKKILKKIVIYLKMYRYYHLLEKDFVDVFKELEKQRAIVKGLREKASDPIFVVKAITEDKFEWYDYNELPDNEKKKYYDQAQQILKMDVFDNEVAKLNSEFINWSAKLSKNFEGVLAMRHQISGINMLKQRLEGIPNPEKKKEETKDPYAPM